MNKYYVLGLLVICYSTKIWCSNNIILPSSRLVGTGKTRTLTQEGLRQSFFTKEDTDAKDYAVYTNYTSFFGITHKGEERDRPVALFFACMADNLYNNGIAFMALNKVLEERCELVDSEQAKQLRGILYPKDSQIEFWRLKHNRIAFHTAPYVKVVWDALRSCNDHRVPVYEVDRLGVFTSLWPSKCITSSSSMSSTEGEDREPESLS